MSSKKTKKYVRPPRYDDDGNEIPYHKFYRALYREQLNEASKRYREWRKKEIDYYRRKNDDEWRKKNNHKAINH